LSISPVLFDFAGMLASRRPRVHAHTPDWRWLLDRDDSPWYPSARLFRQPAVGDWDSVIARLTGELAQIAARP
jgi:hypothetical protein